DGLGRRRRPLTDSSSHRRPNGVGRGDGSMSLSKGPAPPATAGVPFSALAEQLLDLGEVRLAGRFLPAQAEAGSGRRGGGGRETRVLGGALCGVARARTPALALRALLAALGRRS